MSSNLKSSAMSANNNKRCYFSLAASLGSISLACGSLLQIPNSTDRISLQRGLFLTSLGFIYFVSLTDFCNKYLLETRRGRQFRRKYRLMISDVMEITNKLVSAIQAAFSFLVGFIVCKSACSRSFVYASHFLMEAYGWFGTAYFMYDIWSMYIVHTQTIADKLKKRLTTNGASTAQQLHTTKKTSHKNQANGTGLYDKHKMNDKLNGDNNAAAAQEAVNNGKSNGLPHLRQHEDELYDYDDEFAQIPKTNKWDFARYVLTHPVMMIHHVFIGTFGLLVVTYIRGGGHCIYSYIYMMEFSTPFVSLRSILSTMGLKDTRTYVVNGLLMLGTFFIYRVLMWPYVMWRYSLAIDVTIWQAITGLPRGCIISILILFLPQLYWFYLMVKGALKVLLPPKSKKSKDKTLLQTSQKKQTEEQQSKSSHLSTNKSNGVHLAFIENKNVSLSSRIGFDVVDPSTASAILQ